MMIIDTVRATIRAHGQLKKNDRVVIGVSGGPDSLALMHLLASLRKELGLSLHAAHFDHGLRKSSAADREFVAGEAAKLGLGFTAGSARIAKPSEEACRKARLDFLFATARAQKAGKICLGHTLDDQAETVLMRLIRGTGLMGLAAIAPVRQFGRFTVVRPLIEATRAQVEAYCRKKKLRPRVDETNSQDIYLRNRVRRELLPLLAAKYNPNIKEVLGNTAQSAGYDYDYLCKRAGQAAANRAVISLSKLSRLHPSIRRLVLRHGAGKVQGDTRRLTLRHVRELEDLARNRPTGSVVDLPRNVSAVKRRSTLCFYRT